MGDYVGIKKRNLEGLIKNNINVHNFQEISDLQSLISYSLKNDKFSIRFDYETKKYNLPFYTYDRKEVNDSNRYFKKIIDEMYQYDCTLLCSDGYKYDDMLKFNFVAELDQDYNFLIELSDKKVPLRKMYDFKTTVIKGNLFDSYKKFEFINKFQNTYTEEDIMDIIEWFIDKNFKYHYVEGTIYNEKVGLLNDYIVVWQTI